jgi:hypothetical protein
LTARRGSAGAGSRATSTITLIAILAVSAAVQRRESGDTDSKQRPIEHQTKTGNLRHALWVGREQILYERATDLASLWALASPVGAAHESPL